MQLAQVLRATWYCLIFHPWLANFFTPSNRPELSIGTRGERLAERWLLQCGYLILHRNYRTKYSELDLVAVDGEAIVFVEVKTRRDLRAGSPVEAVDDEKQMRLSRAAVAYLRKHQLRRVRVRFDVIAIDFATGTQKPNLVHYRSAFESALTD